MKKVLIVIMTVVLSVLKVQAHQEHKHHGHPVAPEQTQESSKTEGLEFKSFDIKVQAQWKKGPVGNINVSSHLLVRLFDKQWALVEMPEGYTLEFFAMMPSMGHPLHKKGSFVQLEPGLYLNQDIFFNMAGDWRNEIRLLDENKKIVDKVVWNEDF